MPILLVAAGIVAIVVFLLLLRRQVESITMQPPIPKPPPTHKSFTLTVNSSPPGRSGSTGAAKPSGVDLATIAPLDTRMQEHLQAQWREAEALFDRSPAAALKDAERLVGEAFRARGQVSVAITKNYLLWGRRDEERTGIGGLLGHFGELRRGVRAMARVHEGGTVDPEDARVAMAICRGTFERLIGVATSDSSARRGERARA